MPQRKKEGRRAEVERKGRFHTLPPTFNPHQLYVRISLVEKQIEDWKFAENELMEQRERLEEKNQRLHEEQEQYIKILLKQSREFEKKCLAEEKIGKPHVMAALSEKWEASKEEENKLEEMQADILKIERKIAKTRKETARWLEYKNVGSGERERQIQLLEKVLNDMQQSYIEMTEHMEKNLEIQREEIIENTEKTLNRQKHNASENAMSTLDKKARQEVLDNDWMSDELLRYEAQCDRIQKEVEAVEKANLELMGELFECNVEDLKVTRNLFLTQFEDDETLADGGILEVDLKQVSLLEREKNKDLETQRALEAGPNAAPGGYDTEDEEYDEYYDDRPLTPLSETEDPFNNYYNFEDEDITEYLQLGPLQLKLLSLSGEPKPIYVQGGTSSEEIKAREFNPTEWPITQPMLKSVTNLQTADGVYS